MHGAPQRSRQSRSGRLLWICFATMASLVIGAVVLRVTHFSPPGRNTGPPPTTTTRPTLAPETVLVLETTEQPVTTTKVPVVHRGASCAGVFTGFGASHVDLAARRAAASTAPLDPSLVSQLLAYKKKVQSKMNTRNKLLWQPYWTARLDQEWCFTKYPECALFNRTEILFEPASHPVNQFMVRKCCVEHMQLLRAVRSVYAALVPKGVTPWLTAGTLLAAVREGGTFIPWDTDVDVLIEPQHEEAVVELLRAHHKGVSGPATPLQVVEPEEEDDVMQFAAVEVKDVKEHSHGRMIGVIYGTTTYRHEEASRVEIWAAQETRKMQTKALNLPTQPCFMYDVQVQCPKDPIGVIEKGYGPHWCVACKTAASNCKEELQSRFGDRRGNPPM